MEHSLTDDTNLPLNITDLGSNIIDGDALFTNSGGNDYSLMNNSPCIDAGNPNTTGLNLPTLDVLGNDRIDNGTIDIGATEFQSPLVEYNVLTSSSPTVGGNTTGDGSYTESSNVSVSATPNMGYSFVNWTENGIEVSTSSNYSFTITSNRELVANFELTSSIAENAINSSGISIYPNPTNGQFEIITNDFSSAEICDVFGKIIYRSNINFIDLTDHPTGVYLIKVYTMNGAQSIKRIVKK
jgi:hypothetical protein